MIEPIRVQPTFYKKRLILRPTKIRFRAYWAICKLYSRLCPHTLPPGATEAFIEQVQTPAGTEDVWVLDGSASIFAEVLGVIGLKRFGRRPSELGYWLAPAYWGVGLVCEAVRAVIGANPQSSKTFLRR
jgi:RimJ/RimL family protein N-acetyltransferase